MQTGQFEYPSDAEKSMNSAVQHLHRAGYTVLESGLNWDRYTLIFIAPIRAKVTTFVSSQYSFPNEASAAMTQTVNSLLQSGKIVLEARLNWDIYTISYLETPYRGHAKNGGDALIPSSAEQADLPAGTVPAQRGYCTILYQSGTVDAFCPSSAEGTIRCYADVEKDGKQFRVNGDCYSSYGDCYFGGPGAVDHCDQRATRS